MTRSPDYYPTHNKHHILFNRFLWESSADLKRLRTTKELIVPLRITPHKSLHRAIEQVVVPDYHMVKRINKEFYPVKNDPLGTLDNLVQAVDMSLESTYASYTAISVGKLMMNGLMLQRPFIEDAVCGYGDGKA